MPPKAARGTAGRGRGRGGARGGTAAGAERSAPGATNDPVIKTEDSAMEGYTAAPNPFNSGPVLESNEQPSPNSSPVTQPTETPAPTPNRVPISQSDSASGRGAAVGSSSRGDSAAPAKPKFKPRNIRRDQSERNALEAAERQRLHAQTEKDRKAEERANRFAGRSRGNAMGSRGGGMGRGAAAPQSASGLFGVTPGYGQEFP